MGSQPASFPTAEQSTGASPGLEEPARIEDHKRKRETGLPLAAIAVALAGSVKVGWDTTRSVWTTGAFYDTDDATRAVEVRDLLSGQGWFDMTLRRMDPPDGLVSHWSRIVDAPLAGLTLLFERAFPPEYAERATRLLFPLALLAALFGLAAWNARVLRGNAAAQRAAVWLALLTLPVALQFRPGRIDHHAPQIVLLLVIVGLFVKGLEQPRALAWAAAAMALSIGEGLENLPFFAPLVAALPILFLVDGPLAAPQLRWFGVGAAVAFPLVFVATVGPSRYLAPSCDAYSIVFLIPALAGSASLICLAACADRLHSVGRRAAAAALATLVILGSFALTGPACLHGALAVDPLVAELWLDHVTENLPIWTILAADPANGLFLLTQPLLGVCAALALPGLAPTTQKRATRLVSATLAAGLCVGIVHIRFLTPTAPLAAAPLAIAIVGLASRLRVNDVLRTVATMTLCILFSGSYAVFFVKSPAKPEQDPSACVDPKNLRALDSLPTGRVATTIDIGAYVLAHTQHSVFAAPYHRNNHGNRLILDAFLATSAKAETLLRLAGTDLVLWCASDPFGGMLAARASDSLAGALMRGEIPDWLEKRPDSPAPLVILTLKQKG